MKILCSDPQKQYNEFSLEINRAVNNVFESGQYINGSQIKKLETNFSKFNSSQFSLGVSSGTSALEMVLRCLHLEPGDEVLTVSHTAVATASAIVLAGLKPKFVDINRDTYTMCPDSLAENISNKTKAVILVHLYGQASFVDEILEICNSYSVPLIEDCSQAHGAKSRDIQVGNRGIAGCFSCYPTKNLGAIGDAGLITTNNSALFNQLSALREYGWDKSRNSESFGGNYRIDELQASILNAKLDRLNDLNNKRRYIADEYNKNLSKNFKVPYQHDNSYHVYHLYVIELEDRDAFIDFMKSKGIFCGIHYKKPVHKQEAFLDFNGTNLQNTETVCNKIVSLPMYPELTEEEIEYIYKSANSFF